MKKKIMSVVLCCSLCLGLCACDSDKVVDDIVDQAANAVQSEDEHVLAVKKGSNNAYPDVTYEEAFENFFGSPTWKYFKGTHEGPDDDGDGKPDYTEDNIDVVEFTGKCTYQDVEVKALIQFTLDEDGETFDATYLAFNDVPQSMLMLHGLFEKVFEPYTATGETNEETQETVNTEDYYSDSESGESADNSTDYSFRDYETDDDYDYSGLNYAGLYESESGYQIAFSAYSSVEDDAIGKMELYYDGVLENSYEVILYQPSEDDVWNPGDYDAFYSVRTDSEWNDYLGFYEQNGTIMLDYLGPGKMIDTLEMKEHYVS